MVTQVSLTSLASDLCLPPLLHPPALQPQSQRQMHQEPLPRILLLQVWMVAAITILRIICFITIAIRVVFHPRLSLV